jgi:putative membrane protein
MQRFAFISGILALSLAWIGLGSEFAPPFTAHMIMHMGVVAIASPLIAVGISGTRFDPSDKMALFAPLPASLLEFVIVWGWHAPALHGLARMSAAGFVLEQFSFIAVGLILWLSCLGGRGRNGAAGVFGLLFTSMHMTLLGALLALASRPLYSHVHLPAGLTPVEDQNLGGVVMLAVGGAVYLLGALALMARLLNAAPKGRQTIGVE